MAGAAARLADIADERDPHTGSSDADGRHVREPVWRSGGADEALGAASGALRPVTCGAEVVRVAQ
jgi:hypothetical protein